MAFATAAAVLAALIVLSSLTLSRRRSRASTPPSAVAPPSAARAGPAAGPGPTLEDPVLTCGSVWEGGREVGSSSCRRPAESFWASDSGLYCRCGPCGTRGWRVPNGRAVDREEAEAIVAAQQVMLS